MHPLLRGVGLVDLVDSDPRPSFVVALPSTEGPLRSQIVHQNPALNINGSLLMAVLAVPDSERDASFWGWISSPVSSQPQQSAARNSLSYFGVFWTKIVIKSRWIVVTGNEGGQSSEPPRKIRVESGRDGHPTPKRRHHDQGTPTEIPAEIRQSESRKPSIFRGEHDPALLFPDFDPDPEPFLEVIQSADWEHHPLGTMDKWPARLKQEFNQILPDSRPIAIYWGQQHLALYNEAFAKWCGSNHPAVLGKPVTDYWPHLKERLVKVMGVGTGKCVKVQDESRFFVPYADGTSEESYVKWSVTPIMDNGKCVGSQHSLLETTSVRLWERRMKCLLAIGEALVSARDIKSYWAAVLEELEKTNPAYDVPLAFIYSVGEDDDDESSWSRYACPRKCQLEGALGVPEDHPIAPQTLLLRDTDDGLAPKIREALDASYPLLLQTKDGTLPEGLLHGLQWRGFGDPCSAGVICPIRPTTSDHVMGILFLGLNPRRTYDNDYRQFISLLCQKLASQLAATVLLEEEARRGRNAAEQAAYDTAMLQRKLAYQTEQTNRSIHNFKAVAEFIPVGMSFSDAEGSVTYANDAWYRLTGYPVAEIEPGALQTCALEEDRATITQALADLKHSDVVSFEFRVRPGDIESDDMEGDGASNGTTQGREGRYILAHAKAERESDGTVARILTCLTDVTVQKLAAEEANRKAQESENLKRLAELATVGMYDMSMDGRLLSANKLFWELSGLPKVDPMNNNVRPWPSCVVEEDLPILDKIREKLRTTGRPQTAEIRLKAPWTSDDASSSGDLENITRWALASFIPVKNPEGEIESFTGCLSDVSFQKWQFEQEKGRKEEAIDSKRQQENFIDMTSHEMRNPLSAIVHCTDAIWVSMEKCESLTYLINKVLRGISKGNATPSDDDWKPQVDEALKLIRDSKENAEIIIECAQHQKRIVDDILTMSKLDSKLLAVTPTTVNPVEIVKDAVKMFEVEARRVDISLTSFVDQSYHDLAYHFLDFDPSRVKQVLINLLTNALKFTKSGQIRSVTVCLKGAKQTPGGDMTAVDFIPRFCDPADEYEQPGLKGRTNPVYLLFEVKDTGQGLTEKEMRNLFNRFVQASAKTHVKYGGSGLGLFISRRLTELQNGAIGVSSQAGVGSTFAFYIEAYIPSEESRKAAELAAAAAAEVSKSALENLGMENKPIQDVKDGTHIDINGILVVEDNLINQQITRRGLTERGYAVDVANHGIEAVEKLRRSVAHCSAALPNQGVPNGHSRTPSSSTGTLPLPIPITIVLMDVEMPVQDGMTCTRHIRELESNGEVFCAAGGPVPIIAVTANARPEQIFEAKEAGCDDVLVKPYRIPELVEKMQVVMRRLADASRGDE